MDLHLDFETRSATNLKKTGVHVYAECSTTDIWCMAYAFTGQEPDIWLPGQPVPPTIFEHMERGGMMVAHTAAFEITIWREILAPRYGFPEAPAERWRCTMAQAYAMALPGALADVAGALGLIESKDHVGHRLMMSMCKPRKIVGKMPARSGPAPSISEDGWQYFTGADGSPLQIQWWVDGDRKRRLFDYCKQDTRAEMELDKRLLRLRPDEQKLWVLDQKINDRGIYVDQKACHAAVDVVDRSRRDINQDIRTVSKFEVTAATAVAQIITFLAKRKVKIESLAKDHVVEALTRDDLPSDCRRVLELRQKGSLMSVAKIQSLLNGCARDGRAKGLMQYHAASPGRWGGRRFQPQNLKRPEFDQDFIEMLIRVLHTGTDKTNRHRYYAFRAFVDDPISALGSCIRALVTAPPGRKMGSADFSNIEGRGLAWLTGESWKIKAFEAFDAGVGPDLYKLAFSKSFNTPIDRVTKADRQVGKVEELALGYQGGPGAFQAMARGYGVDIGAQYDQLMSLSESEMVYEAVLAWEIYGKKSGMSETNWIAAELVKRAWRRSHPATVTFWSSIEEAAISAVQSPGTTYTLGRLKFRMSGSFLFMQLPSGRALCYPYPRVEFKTTPWGSRKEMLTFFGQDTYTRKWGRTSTYGGKLVENATQAIARDILAEALVRLEERGVETVLHVHDEAVFYVGTEVENCDEYCETMVEPVEWAAGLPLAATGWIGDRYRK